MATPTATSAVARSLFNRMIDKQRDFWISIKAISFWMFLESYHPGFDDLITTISSRDDNFLVSISSEAEAFLSSLQPCSTKPISANLLRITANVAQRSFSLSDSEKILKGVRRMYKEVCCAIFKDILEDRDINGSDDLFGQPIFPDQEDNNISLSNVDSKLNPFAKEWNPGNDRASEDNRSLFLTFSSGYHLTENQIFSFFTKRYGACVERVYVHWPAEIGYHQEPPLFGKVVFKASYIPAMILGGGDDVKFWVDRKPLWCKRFVPSKKRIVWNS